MESLCIATWVAMQTRRNKDFENQGVETDWNQRKKKKRDVLKRVWNRNGGGGVELKVHSCRRGLSFRRPCQNAVQSQLQPLSFSCLLYCFAISILLGLPFPLFLSISSAPPLYLHFSPFLSAFFVFCHFSLQCLIFTRTQRWRQHHHRADWYTSRSSSSSHVHARTHAHAHTHKHKTL